MHLERELATKLGLFQTIFKDVPMGCTDFLINNGQEVGKRHGNAIQVSRGLLFSLVSFQFNLRLDQLLLPVTS